MAYYLLRRLLWCVVTIFGVMLVTFLLFRIVAGDIASSWVEAKAPESQRVEWRHRYGYDRPTWFNWDNRLVLIDLTGGSRSTSAPSRRPLSVEDAAKDTQASDALALILPTRDEIDELDLHKYLPNHQGPVRALVGRYVRSLDRDTPIVGANGLTKGMPLRPEKKILPQAQALEEERGGEEEPAAASQSASGPAGATQPAPASASAPASLPASGHASQAVPSPVEMVFTLSSGQKLTVDMTGLTTTGELIDRINNLPGNRGRLKAVISDWQPMMFFHSQFFQHLKASVLFDSVSLKDDRTLAQIMREHMWYSLALMIPALAIGWLIELVIASLVAYYRGSLGDRIGVFLSVLGMCIPFLAFMMYGQQLMFDLAPQHAYGIAFRNNLYLPVAIMVVAGMGGSVRFYRTVILDETNRDYVRTAKAKGVSLSAILFKHVLKNCMLPILTSLVMSIPFLIMGNLLVERYFGIPGLGDLLLTSYSDRNEPILNGLVYLSALMYTLSVLLTDISYAVFDPRIRLQ